MILLMKSDVSRRDEDEGSSVKSDVEVAACAHGECVLSLCNGSVHLCAGHFRSRGLVYRFFGGYLPIYPPMRPTLSVAGL